MFGHEAYPTRTALEPAGMPSSSLAFGPINGPGLFPSRKHTRSCRCVLARRRGGGASALAYTNMSVSSTCRLMVTDTRSLGLVTQRMRPFLMANSNWPRAVSEMLCCVRGTQTLACGHGTASPSGGPDDFRRPVASAMTFGSRKSRPHRAGTKHVSARAGVLRPASFRPGETP